MDEISESITQIRIVHVAQRVLAEGKLTAVRSFLTEIPASFFPSAQKTKKKDFNQKKATNKKLFCGDTTTFCRYSWEYFSSITYHLKMSTGY